MAEGSIEGRIEGILKTIFIALYSRIMRLVTMRSRKVCMYTHTHTHTCRGVVYRERRINEMMKQS